MSGEELRLTDEQILDTISKQPVIESLIRAYVDVAPEPGELLNDTPDRQRCYYAGILVGMVMTLLTIVEEPPHGGDPLDEALARVQRVLGKLADDERTRRAAGGD